MDKKSKGRPKKPPGHTKGQLLQIRLEQSEKDGFDEAATLAGLPLSAWVRERLRVIARKELEGFGRDVKFLKK
jgi:hypothetical protein